MATQAPVLPQRKSCHDIETSVRRELMAVPGVTVSSLVVRRVPNGVCLQGILRCPDASFDICDAVRRVPGVHQILNQMVVCSDSDVG